MTMNRSICDSNALTRYLDQEVGPEERAAISDHLKQCPDCRKTFQELRLISGFFTAVMEKTLPPEGLEGLEDRVLAIARKRKASSWWPTLKGFLRSSRFYVPAAAAATALALFLYFDRPQEAVSGPSAIINSFTGETTSVIIFETPGSRRTILWFHEISMTDGEDDDVQKT